MHAESAHDAPSVHLGVGSGFSKLGADFFGLLESSGELHLSCGLFHVLRLKFAVSVHVACTPGLRWTARRDQRQNGDDKEIDSINCCGLQCHHVLSGPLRPPRSLQYLHAIATHLVLIFDVAVVEEDPTSCHG